MNVFRVFFRRSLSGLVAATLGMTVAAAPTVHFGPSRPVGAGTARAMVVLDAQGKPGTIGIWLSHAALTGLPGGTEAVEIMLPLPPEVSVPPYTHMTVDWNPAGHVPPKIYDVPHFDFHFYLVPSGEREAITAQDEAGFATAPAANVLPPEYKPAPGGVPRMGAHWVDVTSPEFQGAAFTATFIYGSFNGSVTFLEPMVTLAFLQRGQDFSAPIKSLATYERKGYYPGTYRVVHNAADGTCQILLDQLTYY